MNKVNGIRRLIASATVLCLFVIAMMGITFRPSIAEGARTMSNKSVSAKSVRSDETETQTVFSYKDVFASYYRQAKERMADGGIEMPYTLDEFCDGYYKLGMDIQDYTDFVVNGAHNYAYITENGVSPQSASLEESYILKGNVEKPSSSNFDPDITPVSAFKRGLKYNGDVFDYSNINDGDIVIETHNPLLGNMGHAAFVYNAHKQAEIATGTRGTYIQTIEAVLDGVKFGFLDDTRMVDFGVVIIRSTVVGGLGMFPLEKLIENAKYFMWKQLGKPYSLPTGSSGRVNMDIDSTKWYCTELVYAAYAYGIINLDAINENGNVWAFDLIRSDLTKFVSVSEFIDVDLFSVSGGVRIFKVFNNTNSTITLKYNTKLAFVDDAKNWTDKLKDITTVTIEANKSVIIPILPNVLAGTAVFCREIREGKSITRYITYCTEINSSTLRMKIFKNMVTEVEE
ncbi:MAG: hypothetical protein HFJ21_02480 [Clostridia bacterium]|jgi:hypothetical protein|nr:hypothetical protein [Clostridia bacterium]MCI9459313.1 hypothetical protein [Clostridia bacterium]